MLVFIELFINQWQGQSWDWKVFYGLAIFFFVNLFYMISKLMFVSLRLYIAEKNAPKSTPKSDFIQRMIDGEELDAKNMFK
jgi:hypothetical protein